MTGHYILGIDPGRITAWAACEIQGNGGLKLRGYGIIAQLESGDAALITAVESFLDRKAKALTGCAWSLAFEKAILSYTVHADETTSKVRGCIEAWAIRNRVSYGEYAPATVKACVCSGNDTGKKRSKADVAYAVKDLIGCEWLKSTLDDIWDAIAVMLTHAAKSHNWFPAGRPAKRGKDKFPTAALAAFHERMENLSR